MRRQLLQKMSEAVRGGAVALLAAYYLADMLLEGALLRYRESRNPYGLKRR